MKKLKKFMAIFTVSCLALVGCSKGSDQKGNDDTKEGQKQEQKQEQKSEEKDDKQTADIQKILDANDPMKIKDNSVSTTVHTVEKADGKTETHKSTQIYKLDQDPKIIKILTEVTGRPNETYVSINKDGSTDVYIKDINTGKYSVQKNVDDKFKDQFSVLKNSKSIKEDLKVVGEEDLNGVKTVKLSHNIKINDIADLFGSDGENEQMKQQIEDMKKQIEKNPKAKEQLEKIKTEGLTTFLWVDKSNDKVLKTETDSTLLERYSAAMLGMESPENIKKSTSVTTYEYKTENVELPKVE